ncbi:MAG: barstar family protein [Pseudomonadota bacterium]
MEDLARRLQHLDEAGIYSLNCGVDELRAIAARSGFTLFDADLSDVHSKGELLAVLAQAIHAPDWFGSNWDALADALGDLAWQPASVYILLLQNYANCPLSDAERDTVNEILAGAVTHWRAQRKPFWVFFC